MGQRHQIYLRLPKTKKQQATTVGVHHQWLFGKNTIRRLADFLRRVTNQHNYSNVKNALFEVYYDTIYVEKNVANDPRKTFDNDNGITVIDLTGKTPKFCFMSLWGMQCEQVDNLKVAHPEEYTIDAEDYPNFLHYQNFEPIDPKLWMKLHYGEVTEDTREVVKYLSNFEELNIKELSEIFPKMTSDTLGKGLYTDPNSMRFIMEEDEPKEKMITRKKIKGKIRNKVKNPCNMAKVSL